MQRLASPLRLTGASQLRGNRLRAPQPQLEAVTSGRPNLINSDSHTPPAPRSLSPDPRMLLPITRPLSPSP